MIRLSNLLTIDSIVDTTGAEKFHPENLAVLALLIILTINGWVGINALNV